VSNNADDAAELEQRDTSGLFEAAWYLVQYPDLRDPELEPLGASIATAGAAPQANRYCDPEWCLEQHPDVRAAGMNPLLHHASAIAVVPGGGILQATSRPAN
jgi:hypothetical protein